MGIDTTKHLVPRGKDTSFTIWPSSGRSQQGSPSTLKKLANSVGQKHQNESLESDLSRKIRKTKARKGKIKVRETKALEALKGDL